MRFGKHRYNVEQDRQTVWKYMQLGHDPQDADCMIILGSRDDRVASYAAEIARKHSFATIIITGGIAHGHDMLRTNWKEKTEAHHFLAIMRSAGFEKSVLLEDKAENTGQNAALSYDLLEKEGISAPKTLLLVTKPYMERRAIATFESQWPDPYVEFHVVSPLREFENYINQDQTADDVTHIMVGDFERILSYPARGFQSKQLVPADVKKAWNRLVQAGYTGHLPEDYR